MKLALAEPILKGLGFDGTRVAAIETDDPDALSDALRAIAPMDSAPRPAKFLPMGAKRGVLRFALAELHQASPEPVDVVPLRWSQSVPASAVAGAFAVIVRSG